MRQSHIELPFCDKKLYVLNTEGAKKILRESFVENFIVQLRDELMTDNYIEQMLLGKDGGTTALARHAVVSYVLWEPPSGLKRLFHKYTDLSDYTDKQGLLKDFSIRIRKSNVIRIPKGA